MASGQSAKFKLRKKNSNNTDSSTNEKSETNARERYSYSQKNVRRFDREKRRKNTVDIITMHENVQQPSENTLVPE